MFKNYLKIAVRNLKRNRGYAAINIGGLAVGMAACILIGLWVQHERSYDHFHEKADRIVRIASVISTEEGRYDLAYSQGILAPTLEAEIPEITETVRFARGGFLLSHGATRHQEENLLYADSTVFDVFDFSLRQGDPATALKAPYTIVLTEPMAKKYFGDENPIGQSLNADGERSLTVTGVLQEVPATSHLQFDALVSMATWKHQSPARFERWTDLNFYTYALLAHSSAAAALEGKLPAFTEKHAAEPVRQLGGPDATLTFELEPLTDIYLYSDRRGQLGPTGSAASAYIFSVVALFILLIACINFIDLATARSAERAREVGVRKAMGATRLSLIGQFLAESMLMTLGALLLALGVARLALSAMNTLSGVTLRPEMLYSGPFLLVLAGLTLFVGLAAGSYPAFALSRFQPTTVLKKGSFSSRNGARLRKGLVIFQFALSIALIAGTAVVFTQLDYVRSQDLGFRKEQMLVINFDYDKAVRRRIETIKQQLEQHPAVQGATASQFIPGVDKDLNAFFAEGGDGTMQSTTTNSFYVDYDFLDEYGIRVLAGRAFSQEFPNDSSRAMMLNRAAATQLGFATPEAAVGARWKSGTDAPEGTIVGVVDNFHYESLHSAVEPLSIRFAKYPRYLSLRVRTDHLSSTLADLKRRWQQIVPQQPFEYSFLNDAFEAQYRTDMRFGRIFGLFAGLAILLACLGLFGLAAFTAQQRTKEIGIRKVLGASVASIVALLSKDFAKLVLLAFALAAPLAYVAMQRWLEDFAYRTRLGPGVFLLAGAAAFFIALATVSYQAFKAARTNPTEALRSE